MFYLIEAHNAKEDRENQRWGALMALHANMNWHKGQKVFRASDFYKSRARAEQPAPFTADRAKTWVESCGGTVATIKKIDMPKLSAPIDAGMNG